MSFYLFFVEVDETCYKYKLLFLLYKKAYRSIYSTQYNETMIFSYSNDMTFLLLCLEHLSPVNDRSLAYEDQKDVGIV